MSGRAAVIVCFLALPHALRAAPDQQSSAPTVALEDLRTPSAPGFVLLDVAPSSIQRPTTPKAFAVSLLTAASGSDTRLPTDYAVEVAPYWLTSRPALAYDTWAKPTLRQSIQQTFSLSAAISKASAKAAGAPGHTDISVGVRLSLRAGTAIANTIPVAVTQFEHLLVDQLRQEALLRVPDGPDLKPVLDRIDAVTIAIPDGTADKPAIEKALQESRKALKARIAEDADEIRAANDPISRILAALDESIEADLDRRALAVQTANQRRTGWLLDVAAATAYRVADNASGDSDRVSTGVWISPGYRDRGGRREILGAVRFIERAQPIEGRVLDLGVRAVQQIRSFAMSAEYLRRFGNAVKNFNGADRIAGIVEYKASEGMYLNASFGKGFNDTPDPENQGGLLAILGVTFGFGEKPTVKVR